MEIDHNNFLKKLNLGNPEILRIILHLSFINRFKNKGNEVIKWTTKKFSLLFFKNLINGISVLKKI